MRKSTRRIPDIRIVLIVDADIARAFCDYFEPRYAYNRHGKFYAIDVVANGQEALALYPPGSTMVVEENLPDMTRHEFLLKLGDTLGPEWVSWIDFIFVNEESAVRESPPAFVERYWEVGKPLNFNELERILRALQYGRHSDRKNPITHLPSGFAIENRLKEIVDQQAWAMLYIVVEGMDVFVDQYGWVACDEVVRFTADMIEKIVDGYSASTDFIGHIGGGDFVVIIPPEKAEIIVEHLQVHFASGVQQCYPSTVTSVSSPNRTASVLRELLHRPSNTPTTSGAPPLSLAIGVVRSTDGPFANINEIEDKAAASLRR